MQVEAALIAQQNLRPIIFRPGEYTACLGKLHACTLLGSSEVVLSVHLPGLVYGEAEPVSMTLAVGLTMADKLFNKLKPLAPPDVQVAPF